MNTLRDIMSQRLRELAVEEHVLPGRDDGFTALSYKGREFAHFHNPSEIDIRLGKDVIRRERLVRARVSKVHPDRPDTSPWYELGIASAADVEEAVRLVTLAIAGLDRRT